MELSTQTHTAYMDLMRTLSRILSNTVFAAVIDEELW